MKGCGYFKEQLEALTKGLFDLPFKTGNKAVNKRLDDVLARFKEDVEVKQRCLEACSNGFCVKTYLRARALAAIDDAGAEPKKKTKAKKKEKEKQPKVSSLEITKNMIDEGMDLKAIAKERDLTVSTIYSHVYQLIEQDEYDAFQFVSEAHYNTIRDYFESTCDPTISSAKEVLGNAYGYGEIKMVQCELKRDGLFDQMEAPI